MLLQVFSVYDSKAFAFAAPFFMPAKGMALRSFMDICCEDGHQFRVHPEDYSLFHLGSFDDHEGKFEMCSEPELLARASELIDPDLS